MNILQIISKGFGSGGSKQALQLSEGLRKRGNNVTLVVPAGSNWSSASIDPDLPLVYLAKKSLKAISQIRKLIKKEKIQIIHVHKGKSHSYAWFARLGIKNCCIVANRGVSFPLDIWNRWKYQFGAEKIVAVSEGVKKILEDSGIRGNKIEVVYGGTDLDLFSPDISGKRVREEFDIPVDAPVVGMVAHFREWKGHDFIVKAAPSILKEFPETRFLFVGGGNRKKREIESMVEEMNLQERIILAGRREDVPDCIAAMDISVIASTGGEGLTGALRESLAMEKPVVATKVAGNPEIVLDGKTGLLVPPKSPKSLAEGILKLLKDPSFGKTLGKQGRNFVIEQFSLDGRVKIMESLYEETYSKKSPNPNQFWKF